MDDAAQAALGLRRLFPNDLGPEGNQRTKHRKLPLCSGPVLRSEIAASSPDQINGLANLFMPLSL